METHASTQPPLPEIHYDHLRGTFWIQNSRRHWIQANETTVKRLLKQKGYSAKCFEMETLSHCEAAILAIQRQHDVSYAGPLAGYQTGIREMCGNRILITSAPKLFIPANGEFPITNELLIRILGNEQFPYFLGWLKVSIAAIRNQQYRPGQALVIAGERGCGKSLIQNWITELFGGRSAKPYRYMAGKTDFNGDLFGAEHLIIEDEAASTDIRSRRAFGSALKCFTVNQVQSCHGKNRPAISLNPIWRISVTVNDEPENLQILPPMEESLADKITLFRATKNQMPMPTHTEMERDQFWRTLISEIPAFLAFLEKWEIPFELRCDRFGILHFHHSELLQSLEMLSPEAKLNELIDSVIFSDSSLNVWCGTAERLTRELRDSQFAAEAERLLAWANATGTYLSRLAQRYPKRFICERSALKREWRIYAQGSERSVSKSSEPGVSASCA